MERLLFGLGAASALLSVAAGAFGAHALRARLSPELLAVFETGARYQMYHALGLFAAAWAVTRWPGPWPVRAGERQGVQAAGEKQRSCHEQPSGARWLGAVTPFGGLAFLAGWACLALASRR